MTGQPVRPARVDTRTITWLYIFALSMVALLTLTGQFVVQWSLSALQEDTTTVNDAGRQRMLSQRIPRLALTLADLSEANGGSDSAKVGISEPNTAQIERTLLELRELLSLWRVTHESLSTGRHSSQGSNSNSSSVNSLFTQIRPHVSRVSVLVEQVLERESSGNRTLLSANERAALIEHSDAFLVGMDDIVSQFTIESRRRVATLRWIERGLLLATLLVLICEGCFIFSPAVASLTRAFQRLQMLTEQLEQAKNTAEKANRAKTEFLARVSHELRTPLHAVLGMLSLVRRGRLPPTQRRRVELATKASSALGRLVDDLLDIAGAEAGNPLQIQLSPVDVSDVIDDCVRLMEPLARRKGLSMSADVQLPASRFMLDEFRVRQILINLLQNAIRYTDVGSIDCSCHIEEEGSERWLLIAIRDTGRGIAQQDQERIFENFVRLGTPAASPIGGSRLGLGLPITASLVKSMHGRLTLESQPGRGSTFSVALPLAEATYEVEADADRVTRRKHVDRPPKDPAQIDAVIVDDVKINRLLMKAYLKRLRLSAVSTSNLQRAWDLVQQHKPRWILLDAHLAQEDPGTFVKRVRQATGAPQPSIYVVTADIHFSAESLPADAPVDGVLYKPLAFERLREVLCGRQQSELKVAEPSEIEHAGTADSFAGLRRKLSQLLKQRLPDELERLKGSLLRADAAEIGLIAHRLRGAAANAGWDELAEACSRMEATTNDQERASRVLLELQKFVTD